MDEIISKTEGYRPMRSTNGPIFFLGVSALALACSKTPEPQGSSAPPRAAPTSAASTPVSAGPRAPNDVAWDAPAGWQKAENPSPMRKATYRIPKASGDAEDAELSVSQAGGTVEMNIKRWAGQFSPPAEVTRTEKKVGDLQITIAELHGTFAGSGMPGAPASGPKASWAMLAAIVETATPTFFKMTGPEKTVRAARADFEKLIDGMRSK